MPRGLDCSSMERGPAQARLTSGPGVSEILPGWVPPGRTPEWYRGGRQLFFLVSGWMAMAG